MGDATGFIDPLTGEGLHRALVTADWPPRDRSDAVWRPQCAGGLRSPRSIAFRSKNVFSWCSRHSLPTARARLRVAPARTAAATARRLTAVLADQAPRDARTRSALPGTAARAVTDERRARADDPRRRVRRGDFDEAGRMLLCASRLATRATLTASGRCPAAASSSARIPAAGASASSRRRPASPGEIEQLAFVSLDRSRSHAEAWPAARITASGSCTACASPAATASRARRIHGHGRWFSREEIAAAADGRSRRGSPPVPGSGRTLRSRIDDRRGCAGPSASSTSPGRGAWPQLLPHYHKVTVLSRNGAEAARAACARRGAWAVWHPGWLARRTWSDDSDSAGPAAALCPHGAARRAAWT